MNMDFLSDAVAKGKKFVQDNPNAVKNALDKAEKFIDDQTGHQYSDKIAKADQFADNFVDKQGQAAHPNNAGGNASAGGQ